ncbi:hypothetical protein [Paenibacillus antibioticophila]|nr:hypothetical protein [Paenibacillus antibioticophila]
MNMHQLEQIQRRDVCESNSGGQWRRLTQYSRKRLWPLVRKKQ